MNAKLNVLVSLEYRLCWRNPVLAQRLILERTLKNVLSIGNPLMIT